MRLIINNSVSYNYPCFEQIKEVLVQQKEGISDIELNLNGKNLLDEQYQELFIHISTQKQLSYLKLNFNNSNPSYAGFYYFDCVKKCTSLKCLQLQLEGSALGEEDMQCIISPLSSMKSLFDLTINLNKISTIGNSLGDLGEQLCQLKRLSRLELKLSEISLDDSMLESLLQGQVGVLNSLILDISNNNLDEKSIDTIDDFLEDNLSIKDLFINISNQKDPKLGECLLSMCMEFHTQLRSLKVVSQEYYFNCANLYQYIVENKNLRQLEYSGSSYCSSSDEIDSKRRDNIEVEVSSIEKLRMNIDYIYGYDNHKLLRDTIKSIGGFKNLKDLCLNIYRLSCDIMELSIINRLSLLKKLDLSIHYFDNMSPSDFVSIITEYIQTNHSVQSLSLNVYENTINFEPFLNFVKSLSLLDDLRYFKLNCTQQKSFKFIQRYLPHRLVSCSIKL